LGGAEEEAQEICSRTYAADVYRFPALITLARLRVRRGDQDAETPLEAARRLSATMAELQRSVYIATIVAEANGWSRLSPHRRLTKQGRSCAKYTRWPKSETRIGSPKIQHCGSICWVSRLQERPD
jgi:hypothetical protein